MKNLEVKANEDFDILNRTFYEIWQDGYIYEEDENGMNMSYGEYAAIDNYFHEVLEEYLSGYDFEEQARLLQEIADGTIDDVFIFMNDDIKDFYFEVYEDEYTENGTPHYEYYAENIPEFMQAGYEEWLEEIEELNELYEQEKEREEEEEEIA